MAENTNQVADIVVDVDDFEAGEVNKKKRPGIVDSFVNGARDGWNLGIRSCLPNVVFAFAVIQILNLTGIIDLIAQVASPVMAIFGLPGTASVVLVSAILSMGGASGAAAALYASGDLASRDIAVLIVAIFLMGCLIQYQGRCLDTAGVQRKYHVMCYVIAIFNAVVAMLIMNYIIL